MACIFCDAVSNSLAYPLIYSDRDFGILMDKYPIVRGHVLIFPVSHVPDVLELPTNSLAAIFEMAASVAQALKECYSVKRVGLFTAGKEVSDHGHIHLLPLNEGLKKTFAGLSERERSPMERDILLLEGNRILANIRRKR